MGRGALARRSSPELDLHAFRPRSKHTYAPTRGDRFHRYPYRNHSRSLKTTASTACASGRRLDHLAFAAAAPNWIKANGLCQRRPSALKRALVKSLIIKSAVFPAPVEDTDPLERQRADCGVMVHTSLTGLLIIGLCPRGPKSRICREFMERLAKELGTGHS